MPSTSKKNRTYQQNKHRFALDIYPILEEYGLTTQIFKESYFYKAGFWYRWHYTNLSGLNEVVIERTNSKTKFEVCRILDEGQIRERCYVYLAEENDISKRGLHKSECEFGRNAKYFLQHYSFEKMKRNYCVYCEKRISTFNSHLKTKIHNEKTKEYIEKLATILKLNTDVTRLIYSFLPK